MYQRNRLVRTKLALPKLPPRILNRPRLTERLLLSENYRLTVVQAGTGYGKSMAVAALQDAGKDLVWYGLDREDADPLVFLTHLVHGLAEYVPSLLEHRDLQFENWENEDPLSHGKYLIDEITNELASHVTQPLYLVLEDVHMLNSMTTTLSILNRLIDRCPHHLQPVLITRYPLQLQYMLNWQMHDEVLHITQEELAFTAEEIQALFEQSYQHQLSLNHVTQIMNRIEGWPIALPLIWQKLNRHTNENNQAVPYALEQISGSSSQLFTYLTQEILAQQPPHVQTFLQVTPILRQMTPLLCNQLRGQEDSQEILQYLRDTNLFVVDLENGVSRYHHLFRGVLYGQIPPLQAAATHIKAAEIYRQQNQLEEAFYHSIVAQDYEPAAEIMTEIGPQLVRVGRLDTLKQMVEEIPDSVRHQHPRLWVYLGHVARLRGQTEEALALYDLGIMCAQEHFDRLDIIYALRGKARLFLDTMNPSQAQEILREVLELSETTDDQKDHIRALELMAENRLNQGRMQEAEAYRAQAAAMQDDPPESIAVTERLLLRSGRLWESRRLLEEQWANEQLNQLHLPRSHRETTLLLSLILSYQGEHEQALHYAKESGKRGATLQSPYITAAALNRQGQAYLLKKEIAGYEQAATCFHSAIQLCDELDLPRRKVEALIGLCQIYGFGGDTEKALEVGEEAIDLAKQVGDDWVSGWARLMIGASFALAGEHGNAHIWLDSAYIVFEDCQDQHGLAITWLWRCLAWQREKNEGWVARGGKALLELVRKQQFEFLFKQKTLYGPPDPRCLIPFLLAVHNGSLAERYNDLRPVMPAASRILAELGLDKIETHPGYQLRLQTLGAFRVWRGREEILISDWKRQKARQLFQLLLTYRQSLLEREQIVDLLWPELDPEGGQRDFKISYTTLCKVLEPERNRKSPSAYVMRDGSRYGLRTDSDLWLDVQQFLWRIEEGNQHYQNDEWALASQTYQQALSLYEGEYLQEFPYEEWSHDERERLLSNYLRMAERLATSWIKLAQWNEAIHVCELILAKDDCWEEAYRLLMKAYAAQGQRSLALRIYQRCRLHLSEELGVDPAPETRRLHDTILQSDQTADS